MLSGLLVAGLVFVAVQMFEVRRLDGAWTCTIYSDRSDGVSYRFNGIVLVVRDNDFITGEAGSVYVRSSSKGEFVPDKGGPEPFTGTVVRIALVVPTGIRMVGGLGKVRIELKLELSLSEKN